MGQQQPQDTWIVFDNVLRSDIVKVFWKSDDGTEKHYGDIPPGRSHKQHTFTGHNWVVRSKQSSSMLPVMCCKAAEHLQRFKIPPGESADPGNGLDAPEPPVSTVIMTFRNSMADAMNVQCRGTAAGAGSVESVDSASKGDNVQPGDQMDLTVPVGLEVVVSLVDGGDYLCTCLSTAEPAVYDIAYKREQVAQEVRQPQQNASNYKAVAIQGFQIYVADDLPRKTRQRLVRALKEDLREIRCLLPPPALSMLQDVRLYFNKQYYYGTQRARGMCVHWEPEWLLENGNMAEKAGHMECYSVDDYLNCRGTQPACILHEMSHCYHNRCFESTDQLIKDTYGKALQSGKYDSVKHINGSMRPHYGATNHMEYFAESCEAFFSTRRFRNDFFPFIHDELKDFDPEGYEMVSRCWQLDLTESTIDKLKPWQRKLGKAPPNYDPATCALVAKAAPTSGRRQPLRAVTTPLSAIGAAAALLVSARKGGPGRGM